MGPAQSIPIETTAVTQDPRNRVCELCNNRKLNFLFLTVFSLNSITFMDAEFPPNSPMVVDPDGRDVGGVMLFCRQCAGAALQHGTQNNLVNYNGNGDLTLRGVLDQYGLSPCAGPFETQEFDLIAFYLLAEEVVANRNVAEITWLRNFIETDVDTDVPLATFERVVNVSVLQTKIPSVNLYIGINEMTFR